MPPRSNQLSDLQDHRRSWYAYIQSQEAVIRHRERPLKVKLPEEESFLGDELRLEIIPTDNATQFYKHAKSLLGLHDTDIDSRKGSLSLPWNTTVSPSELTALADAAEKYYFDYRPQPRVQGVIRKRPNDSPEGVARRVELLLSQAGLGIPSQIASTEQTEDYHTKIGIRLLTKPTGNEATTSEHNFLRWSRAETALVIRQVMDAAGFTWKGVKAVMCVAGAPETKWVVNAKDYGDATLIAHLEGLKRAATVQIRDVLYCFRTTSGDKEKQAGYLEEVSEQLQSAFPSLELTVDPDRRRLDFTYYLSFAKRISENLRLQNLLDSFRPELERLHLELQLPPQDRLQFKAKEEPKRFKEDETERLRQLRGEEINIGEGDNRLVLGELVRVNFPFIHIGLLENFTDEQRKQVLTRLQATGEIRPNLTGDREKLARLSGALRRVSDPEAELPNPQTRWSLFDAAAAGGVADPGELKPGSSTWADVATHSYLTAESQTA